MTAHERSLPSISETRLHNRSRQMNRLGFFHVKDPNSLRKFLLHNIIQEKRMSRSEIRGLVGKTISKTDIEYCLLELKRDGLIDVFWEETGGRPREIWISTVLKNNAT